MSKITEASAPFSGASFSPFPQNPNIPTGDTLVDGVSQKTTFPTEISIESLVPYTPRSRKPLEAPSPPLSTPRYTMAGGLNFGKIACPSEAPMFGRKIKVPRGLLVAAEPTEFVFVSEKQCKLPTSPSEAIFTAGKPIKPVRKSLLLAKEPEISFADASVSPGAVFGGTGCGRLDGGDEVTEELEDEVVGISSQDLENSLSLALTTPLPDDDESFSEDELFTLSLTLNTPLPVDTEFDSERALPAPEIGKEPSLEVDDGNTLLDRLEGIDKVIAGLESEAIALKPHAVASAVTYEDLTLYLSIAVQTPLPDDDELCSEDTSLALPLALNTLPLDPQSSSERPLLILECEPALEAEGDGKPFLEAHSAVLAKDMFTAGESTEQVCKHSVLLAEELEGSFADTPVSLETIFKAAGMGILEGADELGDEVVESARTPGTATKGGTDKSSCVPAVSSGSSSEDLTTCLSLALKTPLPEDDEPFSEDELLPLSLALNTPLPIVTEFDADNNKPPFEPLQDVAIVTSPDSLVSTEAIFTAVERIDSLCKGSAVSAKGQEVSPTSAFVSWKVVYKGAETGRPDGRDELVGELGDRAIAFKTQIFASKVSSEDLTRYPSSTVINPLLDGSETCSKDALLALSPAFNAPLPIDTRLDSQRHLSTRGAASPVEADDDNKSLREAPQGAAITRSLDSDISIGVLAAGVEGGCLEGKPDAGAGGEREMPKEKHWHSQSQALQIPNPATEVTPIVPGATLGPKAPLLDGLEPYSQSVPLTHSLAINTPLPVDTEFDPGSHIQIPNIEPPLGTEDANKHLLEAPQDVLITRSPGGVVSKEAEFPAGKPIEEPYSHRALLVMEPEITFVNPLVSSEALFCGVGFSGLTGVDEVIEELEDEVITLKTQTVSSGIGAEDLARSLSLALETPLPADDGFGSEDASLTHLLAVSTPLPVDTESDSESPLLILKRESSPKDDEKESLRDTCRDIGVAGFPVSALLTKDTLATGGLSKPLCQHSPPLSKELGIAFDSASVSPELISSGASLALSLALDTPFPLEAESDFESPLSDLEMESSLESDDRDKPLSEALQDVAISKSPDITISMGELVTGAVNGYLDDKEDRGRKNIDAGNEQDPIGNTHPHSHSLSIKDLSTTTAECAFDLPPQNTRSASKPEAYGHCQIFKTPTVTPSTCAATLDPLHSHTAVSCGLNPILSSATSTGIGTLEPDPTPVGFREAKFEFDFTDIFVGIFREVGVVDLALSTITPSKSAGTTRAWSQDLPADEGFHKNEADASLVGARSEFFTTTKNKLAVRKVFAKLGKVNVRKRVRKSIENSVIKLFNKFSPMPVDVVE